MVSGTRNGLHHLADVDGAIFRLVFLGYVGWAAGNFYATYVLGETPSASGTTWTDTLLVSGAMAPSTNGLVA